MTIVLATAAVTAVAVGAGHSSAPTTPRPPATQKLLMPAGYDPYYRIPATSPEARAADGRWQPPRASLVH